MPTDKDFKRLVRQRMADSGERYTEARAALTNGEPPLRPPTRARSDPSPGTRHVNARVRRRSCQLLDDLALTTESIAALEVCTGDPNPRVRAAALHTLACQHYKPDDVCLDQRMIAERAASDPSAKVRRGVAMGLSWDVKHSDDWAVAHATRFLADPSAEIRRYAQAALDRIDRQRRTDEQRRQLPEPLRTKTERHQLKWVAIAAGQIVAVDPGPSWRRRHPQAQL